MELVDDVYDANKNSAMSVLINTSFLLVFLFLLKRQNGHFPRSLEMKLSFTGQAVAALQIAKKTVL